MSSSQAEKLLEIGGPTVQNRRIVVRPFNPKKMGPAPQSIDATPGNAHSEGQQGFFSMVVTLTECHIIQLFRLINNGKKV
jgi:hypothetical protein